VRDLLTPKQVARAIDVSESSIKRWCDKGVIPTQYTAGGHRRIAMCSLVEFLRVGNHQLVYPEALGLPPTSGQTKWVLTRARDQLVEALIAGDDARCRQITIDLHLADQRLSVICDEVFAATFREIGERWACGEADVYQERRGCEMTLRVLHELRMVLPAPPSGAPLAIGGAATGDQYNLGTTMAELVLRGANWNAVSLGDNLPFESLSVAIKEQRPKLFWLSCSHIADQAEFLSGYAELFDAHGLEVPFVIGGFALTEEVLGQMQFAAYCESMQDLESFARKLIPSVEQQPAE